MKQDKSCFNSFFPILFFLSPNGTCNINSPLLLPLYQLDILDMESSPHWRKCFQHALQIIKLLPGALVPVRSFSVNWRGYHPSSQPFSRGRRTREDEVRSFVLLFSLYSNPPTGKCSHALQVIKLLMGALVPVRSSSLRLALVSFLIPTLLPREKGWDEAVREFVFAFSLFLIFCPTGASVPSKLYKYSNFFHAHLCVRYLLFLNRLQFSKLCQHLLSLALKQRSEGTSRPSGRLVQQGKRILPKTQVICRAAVFYFGKYMTAGLRRNEYKLFGATAGRKPRSKKVRRQRINENLQTARVNILIIMPQ